MSQEKPARANLKEFKMGVPYKLFYRLGFHPWEDLVEHPPFAEKLSELFDREESGREPLTDRRSTSDAAAPSGASPSQSAAGRSRASTSSIRPWSVPASGFRRPVSTCG